MGPTRNCAQRRKERVEKALAFSPENLSSAVNYFFRREGRQLRPSMKYMDPNELPVSG